jgi:hypothetical protein
MPLLSLIFNLLLSAPARFPFFSVFVAFSLFFLFGWLAQIERERERERNKLVYLLTTIYVLRTAWYSLAGQSQPRPPCSCSFLGGKGGIYSALPFCLSVSLSLCVRERDREGGRNKRREEKKEKENRILSDHLTVCLPEDTSFSSVSPLPPSFFSRFDRLPLHSTSLPAFLFPGGPLVFHRWAICITKLNST